MAPAIVGATAYVDGVRNNIKPVKMDSWNSVMMGLGHVGDVPAGRLQAHDNALLALTGVVDRLPGDLHEGAAEVVVAVGLKRVPGLVAGHYAGRVLPSVP